LKVELSVLLIASVYEQALKKFRKQTRWSK